MSTATKSPNFLSRIRELLRLRNVANAAINSRVSPQPQISPSPDTTPKTATAGKIPEFFSTNVDPLDVSCSVCGAEVGEPCRTPCPPNACTCNKHCPVYRDSCGWYFWDETWTTNYGPFNTEEDAHTALCDYTKTI